LAGHRILHPDDLDFVPTRDGRRGIARLSDDLEHTRANVWRLPAGTRGVRHLEKVQEQWFVVLEGAPTLRLGEPPEQFQLRRGSIAIVAPGTALQVVNDGADEAIVLIVGAPPVEGQAEYLPD
jgi:quercetin dioxygenase-like cupin family protein